MEGEGGDEMVKERVAEGRGGECDLEAKAMETDSSPAVRIEVSMLLVFVSLGFLCLFFFWAGR